MHDITIPKPGHKVIDPHRLQSKGHTLIIQIEGDQATIFEATPLQTLALPITVFESAALGQELCAGWQHSEQAEEIRQIIFRLAGRGNNNIEGLYLLPAPSNEERDGDLNIQIIESASLIKNREGRTSL